MKTKFITTIITCFIITTVFSQSNLNNYKYVIVPNKFDFLKKKDQYQLNSLAQFLFKKYGFEAFMEGDSYPEDLAQNRCLALRSDVVSNSGMFRTKLAIELKDCNDQIVYTSKLGESREKDYAKSYMEALRAAFKSMETLHYKYEPKNIVTSTSQNTEAKTEVAKEIQELRQEIQNLKKEKEAEIEVNEPKVIEETKPMEEEVMEVSTTSSETAKVHAGVKKGLPKVLYAQEIENGFQLVDSSPKVVYRIKQTQLKNVFLVENKSAIIYKKGENWVIEYYTNNIFKQDTLNIKF